MSDKPNFHSEVSDAKTNRLRADNRPFWCVACDRPAVTSIHAKGCPKASLTDALVWIKDQEQTNTWRKDRAVFWLNEVRKMHGKLAMLKHENNELRKRLKQLTKTTS